MYLDVTANMCAEKSLKQLHSMQHHQRHLHTHLLAVNSPVNEPLHSHVGSDGHYTDFVLGSWLGKICWKSKSTDSDIFILTCSMKGTDWTCCVWKMSKRTTTLLPYSSCRIQVVGHSSQWPNVFPQTWASEALILTKWQLPSLDRPAEQRCHNYVFPLDWRQDIASNDSVLVIKFQVLWHL